MVRIKIDNTEWLLVAAFFLAVVSYSLILPWNGGPDESTHFFLLEYLYKFGEIPRPHIDPAEPFVGLLSHHVFHASDFWYWGIPYAYILGAWLTAVLFAPMLPPDVGFLAARAFSWLLAIIFALSIIRLCRVFGAGKWQSLVGAAAVLFIPQVIFVFSTLNSDAYGVTAVAIAAIAFERALDSPSRWRTFAFGLACGLILTTKLYFLPSLVFFTCIYCVRFVLKTVGWNWKSAGIFILGALITAAPLLLTTYMHFGEITGVSGQQYFSLINRNNASAGYGTCFLLCHSALIDSSNIAPWAWLTFSSFFGVLGWMNIFLPRGFYHFVFPLIAISLLILSAIRIIQVFLLDKKPARQLFNMGIHLLLFWLMVFFTALFSLLTSQLTLPQPQGRYLFVVIPFLSLAIGVLLSPVWNNDEKMLR